MQARHFILMKLNAAVGGLHAACGTREVGFIIPIFFTATYTGRCVITTRFLASRSALWGNGSKDLRPAANVSSALKFAEQLPIC